MFLQKQLIMQIGMTANDWELTKGMVENSLDTFANAPIILNNRQEFTNYNEGLSDYFNHCEVIGVICSLPNIIIEGNNVYADIIIKDNKQYLWKDKFDNWCIELNDDKSAFKLESIEVF